MGQRIFGPPQIGYIPPKDLNAGEMKGKFKRGKGKIKLTPFYRTFNPKWKGNPFGYPRIYPELKDQVNCGKSHESFLVNP